MKIQNFKNDSAALFNSIVKSKKNNSKELLLLYRSELLEKVVPFWVKHSIDWENGGISTCLSDEGEILSRDKYMWSQLRAIWTFSALYNKVEKKQEWIEIALHISEFVKKYGRDNQGRWIYSVDKDGNCLKGATSIYTDGFAIDAFTELAKATMNQGAIQVALNTYHNVKKRLDIPGSYSTDPLPIPPNTKAHGISMIFSKVFSELGWYVNDPDILKSGLKHADQVMNVFLRPERKRLFEFVKIDNQLLGTQPGLTIVPGHALESMSFMIHIYQHVNDQQRVRQAIDCIRWHIELGWDTEHGGIFLARDAQGTFWEDKWDTKLWWAHAEALYSLLLAYSITGEEWCLNWFESVHNYSFSHYPVPVHGEWFQRLDRYGNHINNIADLPVKDPFHLARSLINCIKVLEKLTLTTKGRNEN